MPPSPKDPRDVQRAKCIASGCEEPGEPWAFHEFGSNGACIKCGATSAVSGAKRGEGYDYPMGGGPDFPKGT
jgi:hypothetical protein